MIRTHLKKTPTPLPETLWRILRKYNLIRTPQEQRHLQFEALESSAQPSTKFSSTVLRILIGTPAPDSKTRSISIKLVKCKSDYGLEMLYSSEKKLLTIHEAYIGFKRAHSNANCAVSELSADSELRDKAFFCDHVVKELYELGISDITRSLNMTDDERVKLERSLSRLVQRKLREMPRGISVTRTSIANQVEVSRIINETEKYIKMSGLDFSYHVVLHRQSTCRAKAEEVLCRKSKHKLKV